MCSLLELLLVLDNTGSDSIHVSGSFLCQSLSSGLLGAVLSLVLDLADETGLLELLEAVSDDLAGALVVLGRANAVSLLATVVGLEGGDTDLASDVELVGDGGSSGVEPVLIVGSEVLVASGLDVLGPLYKEVRLSVSRTYLTLTSCFTINRVCRGRCVRVTSGTEGDGISYLRLAS